VVGIMDIRKTDDKYFKSGRWKCPDSPTGAHHSHEVTREGQYGYFLCKYCLYVQKLPITFDAAMRKLYRMDPGLDIKSL